MSESSGLRKSPANFVMSLFTLIIIWVLLNVIPGYLISSEVTLENMSQDNWFSYFLIVTGVTTLAIFFIVSIWLSYGANSQILERIKEAETKYNVLFMVSVIIGVIGSIVMIILFLGEGNDIQFILLDSILLILSSGIGYWLSTFLFSPKYVEFIPYGK